MLLQTSLAPILSHGNSHVAIIPKDAENSVARVESQTLINPIGKIGSQNWRKIQNLTIFHGHRQLGQPRKKHYKTIQSHSEDSCIGQLNAVFQIIVGYGKILSYTFALPRDVK